jgi:alkylhydroperoxidase/carboxymuconolactone decarboxylase family protein YurZ
MKDDTLPSVVDEFASKQPAVWEAYNRLNEATSEAGPLESKTQRLVKLAIAIGAGHQGAVRSHARRGLKAGLTPEELSQAAMLGITTVGWPQAFAAHCWIQDIIDQGTARAKK